MHVLDGEKPGTVRVLSRGDFGQEMCGKLPTRHASPAGGSEQLPYNRWTSRSIDNAALVQSVTHGTDMAGRYDRLPNQYAPLLVEYPEL